MFQLESGMFRFLIFMSLIYIHLSTSKKYVCVFLQSVDMIYLIML